MRRAVTGRHRGPEGLGWILSRRTFQRALQGASLGALSLVGLTLGGHALSEEPPAQQQAAPPAAQPPVAPGPVRPPQGQLPANIKQRVMQQRAMQGIRAQQIQIVQQEGEDQLADDVVFPTDRDTLQQLERAIKLIEEKRYDEAVRVLGDILHGPEDYFFQPDRTQPIYRSVKSEADRILGGLPEAGRKSYDLQFGAEAKRLLAQAQAAGDAAQLADVARRFFHTASGYEATWLLADHHLDHGRPLSAALCLQRLLASPQAAKWQPTLSTKLAVCFARANLPEKVTEALAQLHALSPQGELHVAGEPSDVPAENGALLAWLTQLAGQPPAAAAPSDSQWTMYRGDPSRGGASHGSSPLLNARWRVPTTDDPLVEKVISQLQQAYVDQGMPAIANLHPLVVDDVILMRTTGNLLAVDFRTGKRLWVAAADDSLAALLDSGQGGMPGVSPQIASSLDQRIWDDATFGTLASDGQLVFSVEDLPLSLGFFQQRLIVGRNGARRAQMVGATTFNRLAAHNVRSGKLVWEIGGQPGDGALDQAGAFFLGPPLPLGGRLYCLAEINSEIRLLTLDAKTGQLEWSQQLALLERSIVQDPGRRQAGLSPSYADGVLVCPTGSGAVVAVDLTTRALLWGYRYPSMQGIPVGQRFVIAQQRMQMPNQGRMGASGWCDSSITVAGGRVVLTPVESQELHCLDLLTGTLAWKQPREDGLYVATLHEGNLIIVCSNEVRAVRLTDGQPIWGEGGLALPEGALPSGRGFASGGRYYLPLTTAEVATLDLAAGKLLARSRSRDGRVPGNLVAYRGAVIAQGPDDVENYFQLDQIEREVNETLAKKPDDAEALALRGEILLHSGQLDDAVAALRKAHEVVAADPRIEQLLVEALLEGLRTDFAQYESAAPELETLVAAGPQRGEFLRHLAAGQLAAGRHEEAFATCLRLADPALGTPEVDRIDPLLSVRRDRWVNTQLAALWAAADEALRGTMSQALGQRLDEAVAAEQPEALRQFIGYFGSLPPAQRARLELAQRLRTSGAPLERELLLTSLTSSKDPQVAAAASALMAELILAGAQPQQAGDLVRRLHDEFAEVAAVDGRTGRQWVEQLPENSPARALLSPSAVWPAGLVKVASENKQNPFYRWPSFDIRGRRSPYFTDTTIDFDPSKRALVARDGSGREVWRLPLNDQQDNNLPFNALTNVAMVSGHLMMIAVGPELFAIDTLGTRAAAPGEPTATGRLLWRQTLADSIAGMQSNIFINPRQLQAAWGPRRGGVGGEMFMQATGSLGMLTDSQAFFIKNRNLVAADLLTGEAIWTRRNVVPGSAIWGDRDVVVVVPPESAEALVFRACDGQQLGTTALPPPEQRLGTIGRWLLAWTNENSKSVVELRDPWPDTPLWRQTYSPEAKAVLIDDDELAVFEPEGRFVIISLPSGRILTDQLLTPEPQVTDIAVFRSAEHYVLMVNRPWQKAGEGVYVQPVPLGLNQSPLNPLANGRVYGFDRRSKGLLWSREIESQGAYLLQPSELPVMVFAANVQRQVRDKDQNTVQTKQECNVLFLDKRNGRVLHEVKFPQNALFEVLGDPAAKTVVVNLMQPQQGTSLTFTFTDEPLPAEEPAKPEEKKEAEPPAPEEGNQ